MEAALRLGLRAAPDHVGANADLGALETLRGDFRAARRHLDTAGEPRWGWTALFESLGQGPVKAGRNHPCPCGSGARFKRCCQPTGGWSLADRAMLLPARVEEWLDRPANLRRRLPLACAAAGVASIHDDPARVVDALMSDAVRGIHLFEAGGIDRLIDELRPVLRADEVPVVESWRGARHQVYEIAGRGRRGWLLRNVAGEIRSVLGLDSDVVDQSSGRLWCALVPAWQRDGDVLLAGCEPTALVESDARHLIDLLDAGASAGVLATGGRTAPGRGRRLLGRSCGGRPGDGEPPPVAPR